MILPNWLPLGVPVEFSNSIINLDPLSLKNVLILKKLVDTWDELIGVILLEKFQYDILFILELAV